MAEYYMARISVRSQVIYIIVMLFFFAAIVLLPIIYVNVTVQGNGIIRPLIEKTEIKALISGKVSKVNFLEGAIIGEGDTILIIEQDGINSRIELLRRQRIESEKYISDLKRIILMDSNTFRSLKYQGEYYKFINQLNQIKSKRDKAKKELDRNQSLYIQKYVSRKDYDDLKYQYKQAQNEYKFCITNQISIWKSDLSHYRATLNEIKSNIKQLLKEQNKYVITAPVSGTMVEFSGIYNGTNIQAGESVAWISPNTELIAEIYIPPKNIGYLRKGTSLNIQVDAFNYNDWGMVKGEIVEISDDFILMKNQPVFKIRCKMYSQSLDLTNGIIGKLKKGMTVRARFLVVKRSLFQLLFDNVNDWLNPAENKI
ncbi:MAG TPA: HlyD family efflux transporter periplasmic adaptor subunit [Bacteroidales bacterium]|nr:HlyD family efflux transporter periplasmic adaptor subunit [Bacteroidales bacterium]